MKLTSLSPKKMLGSSAARSVSPEKPAPISDDISPELVPIVTLLSAQTHRRYHEGVFMLYNDLNGDGNAADRKWKEVYGIMTGNQLAYWDAADLARFKNSPDQLFETSSKPTYLNFTDAVFNAMAVLPAAKQQLENVIIVLTTLKNRYIIQLKSADLLRDWIMCLRLANFEYQSLQEAYTGALLSARGLRLSDIRTILAEKRFNHEDWVKIRYGSGMAWKRCYAVIEPSLTKKKTFKPGRVLLYESENIKKKSLLGVISAATSVTAVYPQLPFFIDKSTIMKLEGSINFKLPSKGGSDAQETALFIMPEQHSSVPGFDTLIRFLVPLYDAFGLYGRPRRLKADRVDPDSLVFGLPTLPHVHYLNMADLQPLTSGQQFLSWDAAHWRQNIKNIMKLKMALGYDGCGSTRGLTGAVSSLNSPRLGSPVSSRHPSSPSASSMAPSQFPQTARLASGPTARPVRPNDHRVALLGAQARQPPAGSTGPTRIEPRNDPRANTSASNGRNVNNLEIDVKAPDSRSSVQLADIYQKYSTIETPSDRFDDRNKLLNGSAEEIDEEVLPSLMRKKSLMHGPYPTSDKHLLGSASESEDDDDDQSSGSMVEEKLRVPYVEGNRNLSYSSVQSPLTQYNEFNQQFSKSVDPRVPSRLQYNSDEDEDEDEDDDDDEEEEGSDSEYEDDAYPPNVPSHKDYSFSSGSPVAQHLPLIKQLELVHSPQKHTAQPLTPSLSERGFTQSSAPKDTSVQKSKGYKNLAQNLSGVDNKPRYIQKPVSNNSAPSMNVNGMPVLSPPKSSSNYMMAPGQQQAQPSQYSHQQQSQQQQSHQQNTQQQQYYQQQSYQQQSHQQPQQQVQAQPQQQLNNVNFQSRQLLTQSQGATYDSQAQRQTPHQGLQQSAHRRPPPLQYPLSQPQQRPAQYQQVQQPARQQQQTQQYQQPPQSQQPQQTHHHQTQYQQLQQHQHYQLQQQVNGPQGAKTYAGQNQSMPSAQQRMQHPYYSRVASGDAPQTQGYKQAMPSGSQPSRPQMQNQQSAQSIRSYGDQQYQYQAQPSYSSQQGAQKPQQNQDPRYAQSQNQGYMRQY